jgi:hypothetical protein
LDYFFRDKDANETLLLGILIDERRHKNSRPLKLFSGA